MANAQNLTPVQPGQVLNPNGRPKGTVNRKTILNWLLFEADIDDLGIVKPGQEFPSWWKKTKPKRLYEAMTLAAAVRAVSGEMDAFNALNRALGLDINAGGQVDVVHIFKPEKLTAEQFNQIGAEQRKITHEVIEAEIIDGSLESPARASDLSITSP